VPRAGVRGSTMHDVYYPEDGSCREMPVHDLFCTGDDPAPGCLSLQALAAND
jgi:hypothetical protein